MNDFTGLQNEVFEWGIAEEQHNKFCQGI